MLLPLVHWDSAKPVGNGSIPKAQVASCHLPSVPKWLSGVGVTVPKKSCSGATLFWDQLGSELQSSLPSLTHDMGQGWDFVNRVPSGIPVQTSTVWGPVGHSPHIPLAHPSEDCHPFCFCTLHFGVCKKLSISWSLFLVFLSIVALSKNAYGWLL